MVLQKVAEEGQLEVTDTLIDDNNTSIKVSSDWSHREREGRRREGRREGEREGEERGGEKERGKGKNKLFRAIERMIVRLIKI